MICNMPRNGESSRRMICSAVTIMITRSASQNTAAQSNVDSLHSERNHCNFRVNNSSEATDGIVKPRSSKIFRRHLWFETARVCRASGIGMFGSKLTAKERSRFLPILRRAPVRSPEEQAPNQRQPPVSLLSSAASEHPFFASIYFTQSSHTLGSGSGSGLGSGL